MNLRTICCLAVVSLFPTGLWPLSGAAASLNSPTGKLRVVFIDVEGGQATLFITPQGQSLLIDTGWDGNNGRDADRIVSAARHAGLTRIDDVLITHFHQDHVGGVPQLSARIPIGTFIDHGENRELEGRVPADYQAYLATIASTKAARIVAKPGDLLPIPGIGARVISADGNLIAKALPGAGQANPFCQSSETKPADQTENARSVGIEITFGKLKILDLGDLTWDKEMQLMCPTDKLGRVDILIVSHHGWLQSSSPALVDRLQARVAIMDNGETKGGSVSTMQTLEKAPGLETLWQLHYSAEGGAAHNTKAEYIANLPGPDAGDSLQLAAGPEGTFDVTNARTGVTKHYPAR